MAGLLRRLNGALSGYFPEKRLFIQSRDSTRYLRLTPLTQLLTGTAALALAGWMAVATATVVVDVVAAGPGASQAVVIRDAYRARLESLAAERDQRAAEARSAQERFQVAMQQISRQQTAILQAVEERRELAIALDAMRGRLTEAVAQRDSVASTNDRLLAQMNEVSATLTRRGATGADLTETLRVVSAALSDAVADRDLASEERAALAQELADLELKVQVNNAAPGRDGGPARAGGRHVLRAAGADVPEERRRRRQPDRHRPQHLFRPGRPARRAGGFHALLRRRCGQHPLRPADAEARPHEPHAHRRGARFPTRCRCRRRTASPAATARAAGGCIAASTSPPRAAPRSSRRPRAWWSRRSTRAATATSSASITSSGSTRFMRI